MQTPNRSITFTFDLEDHRPADRPWPARYPRLTRVVLDWLDDHAISATVFVVGSLALDHPDLMVEIAARGHDVALHNWEHVQLTAQTPAQFREGVRRGKATLEDLTGTEVVGFRAPTASLVPATTWAVDVLVEEGFAYSSSVCPAPNPLNGFPGAPLAPFTFAGGLCEFPVRIARLGPVQLPFLGGTYLRVLPRPVVSLLCRRYPPDATPLYCHPYDFDVDEPFWWVGDVGWMSPLLWVGRRSLLAKLERLAAHGTAPPLRDQLERARAGVVFDHRPFVDSGPAAAA